MSDIKFVIIRGRSFQLLAIQCTSSEGHDCQQQGPGWNLKWYAVKCLDSCKN